MHTYDHFLIYIFIYKYFYSAHTRRKILRRELGKAKPSGADCMFFPVFQLNSFMKGVSFYLPIWNLTNSIFRKWLMYLWCWKL